MSALAANHPDCLAPTWADIEGIVCEHLSKEHRCTPRRQVRTPAGVADIVTHDAIYEVKTHLTRPEFYQAVGQVLLYRQALGAHLRAVVVGLWGGEVPADEANALGVEVWFCDFQLTCHQLRSEIFGFCRRFPDPDSKRKLFAAMQRAADEIQRMIPEDLPSNLPCHCRNEWRDQLPLATAAALRPRGIQP